MDFVGASVGKADMAAEDDLKKSVKVNFTPVYGVLSDAPVCFILDIDDVCILLDCGWREPFDLAAVQALKQ